jgi:hypothetical protein
MGDCCKKDYISAVYNERFLYDSLLRRQPQNYSLFIAPEVFFEECGG